MTTSVKGVKYATSVKSRNILLQSKRVSVYVSIVCPSFGRAIINKLC
jgi:hypothetical protein